MSHLPANSPSEVSDLGEKKQYWLVLAFALVVLWAAFGFFIHLTLVANGGRFVYALDDAYITMAVARNFAQNGTWGIQPGQFTSLASSPAWVLLMSGMFHLTQPSEWTPLVMNIVCSSLLIVLLWAAFRSFRVPPAGILLALLVVLVLTPVIPVAFTGLEHILQMSVDLAYIFAVAFAVGIDAPPSSKRFAGGLVLALSPVLTLVRYEGIFLIAIAGGLLLARRRFIMALLTGVLGMIPIVVSGLIFISKGWFFFPSTLIQKGNMPKAHDLPGYFAGLVGTIVRTLYSDADVKASGSHIAVLLGLVLFGFICARPALWSRLSLMVMMFLGTTSLHLALARVGWFYRYEAYLICIGLVLFILLAVQLPWKSILPWHEWPRWANLLCLTLAAALLGEPLWERTFEAHIETPIATHNVWEQQYQMAQFLHRYYEGASVAANDIGAINYFARIHCLDITGLADPTVLRWRVNQQYTPSSFNYLIKQNSVKIMVGYESWAPYFGGIPTNWVKAGDWMIFDNCISASPMVSFFATDPKDAPALRSHLREFYTSMPKSIYVRITSQ